MPATHHSVFTGRMPFLPPNQQRQSTEGTGTEGTEPKNQKWKKGWGKGGNVSSAGWQVTLCDPVWRVSSRGCYDDDDDADAADVRRLGVCSERRAVDSAVVAVD